MLQIFPIQVTILYLKVFLAYHWWTQNLHILYLLDPSQELIQFWMHGLVPIDCKSGGIPAASKFFFLFSIYSF